MARRSFEDITPAHQDCAKRRYLHTLSCCIYNSCPHAQKHGALHPLQQKVWCRQSVVSANGVRSGRKQDRCTNISGNSTCAKNIISAAAKVVRGGIEPFQTNYSSTPIANNAAQQAGAPPPSNGWAYDTPLHSPVHNMTPCGYGTRRAHPPVSTGNTF